MTITSLFKYKNFPEFTGTYQLLSGSGRVNIYRHFTDTNVWPRGLGYQFDEASTCITESFEKVAVWQGLADNEPDVDAIYRLAGLPTITFNPSPDCRNVHCIHLLIVRTHYGFTILPYAYLPSTCSFRYTDILRGYIAQPCIWVIIIVWAWSG